MPVSDPHRDEYLRVYRAMASSLKELQQAEGYWSRSLLNLSHAPGYETSGTALFLYGYLCVINNGLLSEKEYSPVVKNGWKYLTNIALQENGLVGYVQPIGERADQHRNVCPATTGDFGVGAFLLAASEMVKYVSAKSSFSPGAIWRDDQVNHINAHGGGILYHEGTYYWYGEHRPQHGFITEEGVTCYSSKDLYNWKYEGVVMPVSGNEESPIVKGCIIERPKVIYNEATKKFVMYFHLELKGQGYAAADYLSHTGRYIRVAPGGHNEAPAIFKKDGCYYMITSGCTGWEPNAGRLLVADESEPPVYEGYKLVWHDEFNREGPPDPAVWSFEEGFVRNHELQWYQRENAFCRDGSLIITARPEKRENPLYEVGNNDWRRNRK